MDLKYGLIVFGLIIAIFFSGCLQDDLQKSKCCTECINAFSQSPVGVGPQGAFCGNFMTANPISKECNKYFSEKEMTVTDCTEIKKE